MKLKKYTLDTKDTVEHGSRTLYRVVYSEEFAERMGIDRLGGYIESECNLSQEGDARVSGNARVSEYARVSGNAKISGNARVSEYARVSGNAKISGNARVFGNAKASGNEEIMGSSEDTKESAKEAAPVVYDENYLERLRLSSQEWQDRISKPESLNKI